jgi:ribosomal subunit interface protein
MNHSKEHSPWLNQLIERKVEKLQRYISPTAKVSIYLKNEDKTYISTIDVLNMKHHHAFTASGLNLYEAFSFALDKATRALSEHKRKLKNRIHSSAA